MLTVVAPALPTSCSSDLSNEISFVGLHLLLNGDLSLLDSDDSVVFLFDALVKNVQIVLNDTLDLLHHLSRCPLDLLVDRSVRRCDLCVNHLMNLIAHPEADHTEDHGRERTNGEHKADPRFNPARRHRVHVERPSIAV